LALAGIVRYRHEGEKLFYEVDTTQSGEVDFAEFLEVLNPKFAVAAGATLAGATLHGIVCQVRAFYGDIMIFLCDILVGHTYV
jgi:hypothetical protein